jgi:ornithine carbamoyltransferase
VVGILFLGPSTRTRTAFTTGALHLGASTIAYGREDLQLSTGEPFRDTGRVLAGFLDHLVVRTNRDHQDIVALAEQNQMSVINAMSDREHPTQAIGDLALIEEKLGRLHGVHLLYLGEGNNTAVALAFAAAQVRGMRLDIFTPAGFGIAPELLAAAQRLAGDNGSIVEQCHDTHELPTDVDVIYTTRWQTMGVPKAMVDWREAFRPFAVTRGLLRRVSKRDGTIFLHDLPAVRGEEVEAEVIDGDQSVVFRQAQYKLFGAMAVLEWAAMAPST